MTFKLPQTLKFAFSLNNMASLDLQSKPIAIQYIYEMYLHCKNNQLCKVWAYLWTNWYSSDNWKLWARSAYPYIIPQKQTTMVVGAMW